MFLFQFSPDSAIYAILLNEGCLNLHLCCKHKQVCFDSYKTNTILTCCTLYSEHCTHVCDVSCKIYCNSLVTKSSLNRLKN